MASINEIQIDNIILDTCKNSRKLKACDIIVQGIPVGRVKNYEELLIESELYADILARSKDYLLHHDLFNHDIGMVCSLVDERLYDKVILAVLKDLMILADLEVAYMKKAKTGDIRLRTTIDKVPVIFDDKSKFVIVTENYGKIKGKKKVGCNL